MAKDHVFVSENFNLYSLLNVWHLTYYLSWSWLFSRLLQSWSQNGNMSGQDIRNIQVSGMRTVGDYYKTVRHYWIMNGLCGGVFQLCLNSAILLVFGSKYCCIQLCLRTCSNTWWVGLALYLILPLLFWIGLNDNSATLQAPRLFASRTSVMQRRWYCPHILNRSCQKSARSHLSPSSQRPFPLWYPEANDLTPNLSRCVLFWWAGKEKSTAGLENCWLNTN